MLCKPQAISEAWPLAVKAWLIAALVNAAIDLVQYFGVSAQFGPRINPTGAIVALGNLRQREQFATLTSRGLAILSWLPLPFRASLPRRLRELALLAIGNAALSRRTGMAELATLVIRVGLWVGCSGRRHAAVW